MRNSKIRRLGVLLSAALVATVTLVVSAHAVQTISAVTLNAVSVPYSLPAHTDSGALGVAASVPVLIFANQNVAGDVGSTLVTIVNQPGEGELVWNGLESDGGGIRLGLIANSLGIVGKDQEIARVFGRTRQAT